MTINGDKVVLKKQVAELNEKSKNTEYIIRGKLEEKDEQIKNHSDKFNTMQSMLEKVIAGLGKATDQQQVNTMAASLFSSGVLKLSTENIQQE